MSRRRKLGVDFWGKRTLRYGPKKVFIPRRQRTRTIVVGGHMGPELKFADFETNADAFATT